MLTLSDILDDLQTADQALRRFEQRYWISTSQFYALYSQGQLDTGDHTEDFAEWSGFYKFKQKREQALENYYFTLCAPPQTRRDEPRPVHDAKPASSHRRD